MIITSGFRSTEFNKSIGGVNNSQHLKGEAVDYITEDKNHLLTIFNNIDDIPNVQYDQIIIYYIAGHKIPRWIHISRCHFYNRTEKLICNIKKNGRKEYQIIEN